MMYSSIKKWQFFPVKLVFTMGCIALGAFQLAAQVHWSQHGVGVTITPNTAMYAEGSLELINNASIVNEGEVQLENDWINNSNDNALNPSGTGQVALVGDTQRLTGSAITTFYNIELLGTGVKFADTSLYVDHYFNLNDRILFAGDNLVQLNLPDDVALQRTTGYIAVSSSGVLQRATNTTNAYEFPLGVLLPNSLRPLEITPDNNQSAAYAVSYSFADPTLSGYDIQQKDAQLCYVNDAFFHRISQVSGNTTATISVATDPNVDKSFNEIANWSNNLWTSIGNGSSTSGSLQYFSSNNSISGFADLPIALALNLPPADCAQLVSIGPILNNENEFSVYPIPTSGVFNIQLADASTKQTALDVFNVLGQKVYSQEINAGETLVQCNVEELPSGQYILRLSSEGSEARKLIQVQ